MVTDENGELFVALDHDDVSDSPVPAPAWQKRVPFVRFSGHVTQNDVKVQPLKYTRMSATELAAAVRKAFAGFRRDVMSGFSNRTTRAQVPPVPIGQGSQF